MMWSDGKVDKGISLSQVLPISKTIDGLAALIEPNIKATVFDSVRLVFLNKPPYRADLVPGAQQLLPLV
jgi:hypothetical protein